MTIGKNKEEELIQLENLVKREKLAGHIIHHFYYHLRNRYPLEFIYLARKYNKSSPGHQHYIQEAKEQINKLYGLMNHYLLIPPKTDEQIKEFGQVVDKLESLLIKQSKEN